MMKQLDLIYKGGAFFPLSPLQGVFEGDKVQISLLNIIRAIPEEAEDPGALDRAIAKMMNRTPEEAEAEAARVRLFQRSRAPREIPNGQTLNDVVYGKWPGEESEEEVLAALEKLS